MRLTFLAGELLPPFPLCVFAVRDSVLKDPPPHSVPIEHTHAHPNTKVHLYIHWLTGRRFFRLNSFLIFR